jgi:hypothetical protein
MTPVFSINCRLIPITEDLLRDASSRLVCYFLVIPDILSKVVDRRSSTRLTSCAPCPRTSRAGDRTLAWVCRSPVRLLLPLSPPLPCCFTSASLPPNPLPDSLLVSLTTGPLLNPQTPRLCSLLDIPDPTAPAIAAYSQHPTPAPLPTSAVPTPSTPLTPSTPSTNAGAGVAGNPDEISLNDDDFDADAPLSGDEDAGGDICASDHGAGPNIGHLADGDNGGEGLVHVVSHAEALSSCPPLGAEPEEEEELAAPVTVKVRHGFMLVAHV